MSLKKYLKTVKKANGSVLEYIVKCDDANRPDEVECDKFFNLWETKALAKYLKLCDKHKLKYTLVIQDWNSKTDEHQSEICIIDK